MSTLTTSQRSSIFHFCSILLWSSIQEISLNFTLFSTVEFIQRRTLFQWYMKLRSKILKKWKAVRKNLGRTWVQRYQCNLKWCLKNQRPYLSNKLRWPRVMLALQLNSQKMHLMNSLITGTGVMLRCEAKWNNKDERINSWNLYRIVLQRILRVDTLMIKTQERILERRCCQLSIFRRKKKSTRTN